MQFYVYYNLYNDTLKLWEYKGIYKTDAPLDKTQASGLHWGMWYKLLFYYYELIVDYEDITITQVEMMSQSIKMIQQNYKLHESMQKMLLIVWIQGV